MTIQSIDQLFADQLPVQIKQARARAVEHPSLFLKGKLTGLVQVIITYTNLEGLDKPVLFRRTLPAKLLQVSTRTIDRLLLELESLGWLKRLAQPRLAPGVWGCTSIAWNEWVVRDIFAIKSKQRLGQIADAEKTGNRATSVAHHSFSSKEEAFQDKPAHAGVLTSTEKNKTDIPAETLEKDAKPFDPFKEKAALKAKRIPQDLNVLVEEFGLTHSNICWLMSKCKAKNVRLQHVVGACFDALKQKALAGRQAVAWLMHMIGLDRDFEYECRSRAQKGKQIKKETKQQEFLEAIAKAMGDQQPVLPSGHQVAQYANGVITLKDTKGRLTASPGHVLAKSLAATKPGWVKNLLRGSLSRRNNPESSVDLPNQKISSQHEVASIHPSGASMDSLPITEAVRFRPLVSLRSLLVARPKA